MTDAHKIYTAWTQMWNGHLDIADELLSPHFKAHLTADSTPPPAPVTDIASAKAWIATIRAIGIGKYATILLVQAALLFAANYLLQYLPLDHLDAKATIILTDLCNTTAFSLIYLYPAYYLPPRAQPLQITP